VHIPLSLHFSKFKDLSFLFQTIWRLVKKFTHDQYDLKGNKIKNTVYIPRKQSLVLSDKGYNT